MDARDSLETVIGKCSDGLLKEILYEYKYLRSLMRVTRGITHNYNNIFAGAMGQLSLDSEAEIENERKLNLSELINRGVEETETLFSFARLKKEKKEKHSLEMILYHAVLALRSLSPSTTVVFNITNSFLKVEGRFNELLLLFFYIGEFTVKKMQYGSKITFNVVNKKLTGVDPYIDVFVVDNIPGKSPVISDDLFSLVSGFCEQDDPLELGVSIAAQIALDHGGGITVEDTGHEGTIFRVRLPVVKESEKTFQRLSDDVAVEKHIISAETKYVFFVIDDDEILLNYVVKGLQRNGHMVFSAGSCSEAVDEFTLVSEIVTIFLVDVGLTDCDGFECVKQLAEINSAPPIIFTSGDMVSEQGKLPPKSVFIPKPFTVRQLEEIASNVVAKF